MNLLFCSESFCFGHILCLCWTRSLSVRFMLHTTRGGVASKMASLSKWRCLSAERSLLHHEFGQHHRIPPPHPPPSALHHPSPSSHCNLSCQLPRFVFGSDPSPSVERSHSMFTSAPEAFLPAHYSCFLLSAKWIPIKSTVHQLELGRIYLVQRTKSHRLTSFSHVAPFLESVTQKMSLVISCKRILLGFFVFSVCSKC